MLLPDPLFCFTNGSKGGATATGRSKDLLFCVEISLIQDCQSVTDTAPYVNYITKNNIFLFSSHLPFFQIPLLSFNFLSFPLISFPIILFSSTIFPQSVSFLFVLLPYFLGCCTSHILLSSPSLTSLLLYCDSLHVFLLLQFLPTALLFCHTIGSFYPHTLPKTINHTQYKTTNTVSNLLHNIEIFQNLMFRRYRFHIRYRISI